jgi:hypothetical protein
VPGTKCHCCSTPPAIAACWPPPNLANGETGRPGGREVCSDVVERLITIAAALPFAKKKRNQRMPFANGFESRRAHLSMQSLA